MSCQSSEELNELLLEAKHYTKYGTVADYIPALKKANPHDLSATIYYPDGTCLSAGDIQQKMTLQSISESTHSCIGTDGLRGRIRVS